MKLVLIVMLTPLLLVPLAAAGVLVMACDMHVGAVDGMKDKGVSAHFAQGGSKHAIGVANAQRRAV